MSKEMSRCCVLCGREFNEKRKPSVQDNGVCEECEAKL